MPPVRVQCPHCSASLKLAGEHSFGHKARCPRCKKSFIAEEPPTDPWAKKKSPKKPAASTSATRGVKTKELHGVKKTDPKVKKTGPKAADAQDDDAEASFMKWIWIQVAVIVFALGVWGIFVLLGRWDETQYEWMMVSTHSSEREKTVGHERGAQEAQLAEMLKSFDMCTIDDEELQLLAANRDSLQKMLKESQGAHRARAAAVLHRLGDPGAAEVMRGVLAEGKPPERIAILKTLAEAPEIHEKLREDESLKPVFIAHLDHESPRVADAAVDVCAAARFPEAPAKLRELLKSKKTVDKARIARWISQIDPDPEIVGLVFDLRDEDRGGIASWALSALLSLADCDHSEAAEKARGHLMELIERNKAKPLGVSFLDGKVHIDRARLCVLRNARMEDLPWLHDQYRRESLDSYQKAQVISAIARVGGEDQRRRLFEASALPEQRPHVLRAIGECYAGTADRMAVNALLAASLANADGNERAELARAFQAVGGDEAYAKLEEIRKFLPAYVQGELAWTQEGLTLESVKDRIVSAGLVAGPAYDKALAAYRTEHPDNAGGMPDLVDLLIEAKAGVAFDAETSGLPCRHDKLIKQFAAGSNGLFQPDGVYQTWEPGEDGGYLVQFTVDGRTYQLKPRHLETWYDVERVVLAINQALGDSQRSERFAMVDPEGKHTQCIIVTPEGLKALSDVHVHFTSDYHRSVSLGKDIKAKILSVKK